MRVTVAVVVMAVAVNVVLYVKSHGFVVREWKLLTLLMIMSV